MGHGRRENPLHTRAKAHFWCPACHAEPGEPCVRRDGFGQAWPPHKGRLDAARDHRATYACDRCRGASLRADSDCPRCGGVSLDTEGAMTS